MIFNIHYVILSTTCFSIIACSESASRYETVYKHYGIENPINIYVDKTVTNLYPKDFDYFVSQMSPDTVLGNGTFLEAINDSILVVVVQNQLLKKVNLKSLLIEEERIYQGNGPGEYGSIDDILKIDSSIFIFDKNKFKLIEYDRNLNHIRDIKLSDVETINQRSTGALSSNFFYYPIYFNEDYLYSRIDLKNKTSVNYHKRFIPTGKQPIAYNAYLQSTNSKEELLLASNKMPLFFIYDSTLQLKNLYKLDSPIIDKVETSGENENSNRVLNPPPKILDSKTRVSFNGFSIIDAIIADEIFFIYFSNRFINDRYLIVLKRDGDKWTHLENYRFLKNNKDVFTVFDMTYSSPWLYLSSQFEEGIIRIDTQKL